MIRVSQSLVFFLGLFYLLSSYQLARDFLHLTCWFSSSKHCFLLNFVSKPDTLTKTWFLLLLKQFTWKTFVLDLTECLKAYLFISFSQQMCHNLIIHTDRKVKIALFLVKESDLIHETFLLLEIGLKIVHKKHYCWGENWKNGEGVRRPMPFERKKTMNGIQSKSAHRIVKKSILPTTSDNSNYHKWLG